MACHQCDHTMQSISEGIFWCPRCGSIKYPAIGLSDTPDLVNRVIALPVAVSGSTIKNLQLDFSKPVEGE